MKVRSALRKMCAGCRIVKRGKKVTVVCKDNPKHKQRQGFSTAAFDASRPAAAAAAGFAPMAAPSIVQLTRSVLGLAVAGEDAALVATAEDEDGGT